MNLGYVPPPPPPVFPHHFGLQCTCRQCVPPVPNAGHELYAAVLLARRSWWQRLLCRIGLHAMTRRCGHRIDE